MTASADSINMALFCDFENVALGVRDAKYDKFDIKPVLERLLLKGSIVVKKAYCDWDRYKSFKATMHEANFELIEIPHLRQSGKNSADIRLVVDALDLCYTKSHVDTFVIISGDSDFSPLVSKLRENAKQVIGVGVKQSTSDLLIANCDEFIFYDDLVRERQRAARRDARDQPAANRRSAEDEGQSKEEVERRRSEAILFAVETLDDLMAERGDDGGKIWASMLKQAIKRRRPHFNESYYGFRAFGNLLDEAQARGLLSVGRDEKSGTYVQRAVSNGDNGMLPAEGKVAAMSAAVAAPQPATPSPGAAGELLPKAVDKSVGKAVEKASAPVSAKGELSAEAGSQPGEQSLAPPPEGKSAAQGDRALQAPAVQAGARTAASRRAAEVPAEVAAGDEALAPASADEAMGAARTDKTDKADGKMEGAARTVKRPRTRAADKTVAAGAGEASAPPAAEPVTKRSGRKAASAKGDSAQTASAATRPAAAKAAVAKAGPRTRTAAVKPAAPAAPAEEKADGGAFREQE